MNFDIQNQSNTGNEHTKTVVNERKTLFLCTILVVVIVVGDVIVLATFVFGLLFKYISGFGASTNSSCWGASTGGTVGGVLFKYCSEQFSWTNTERGVSDFDQVSSFFFLVIFLFNFNKHLARKFKFC